MSIFSWEDLRVGEFIAYVLTIHDHETAKQFVVEYRAYLERMLGKTYEGDMDKLLRFNIGWCFGEGMSEADREMWQEVCNAAHPIFGTTMPSFDEALQAGIKAGKEMRK